MTTIKELSERIHEFCKERNWDKYHSPKNLAMSVAIEAGELMEHFQWIESNEAFDHGKKNSSEISDEIADVAIYLFDLARTLEIDLGNAITKKMKKNAIKYPA
ncbi:nucleotide pyrophosphohydrolase [Candidatus Uhrbacteria bacterium]|nr:nucleotide pyrophosphohydrolase [Candidatus Uhrbacteria bacterium]